MSNANVLNIQLSWLTGTQIAGKYTELYYEFQKFLSGSPQNSCNHIPSHAVLKQTFSIAPQKIK